MALKAHAGALPRAALSRWGVLFAFAGIAGIGLRIWIYRANLGTPDSDEAVMGLMVRHFAHGEFSTFYWGQPYGGTQEVFLTMPIFLVFGSSFFALRVVPIALSAVAALLVWRIGRRTIGEPAAGVAGALFWVWPPFTLYMVTRQQGFYGSNLVYCSLLLLLALRAVERPDRLRAGLFGLVLGLAFWQTAQIVPLAVPTIAWMIWKQPRCLRKLWVAAPMAVLGALPWIVWNVRHDWGSFLVRANPHEYAHSLRIFVSPLVPMLLGLRAPLTSELLVPSKVLVLGAYAALVALFAYCAVRTRHREISLLYTVVALFPFVWALARRVTYLSAHPRFIVVLSPLLVLLVAQVASRYWRAAALLSLAVVVSMVTLQRMEADYRAVHPRGLPVAPRDFGSLVSTLDGLGIDHVYADYWIAYRLAFDTRERIIGSMIEFEPNPVKLTLRGGQAVPPAGSYTRYPPYAREVQAAPHAFVFFRQTLGRNAVASQLVRLRYRRLDTGPFVVYVRKPGAA